MLSFTINDYKDIINLQRPVSIRPSMEISHRAKQFAPFAALQGFEDNIKLKGLLYEEKKILSDDRKCEIDYFLQNLSIGDEVTVTFFHEHLHLANMGEYHTISGTVNHWNPPFYLKIEDVEINIGNIYNIKN